MSAATYYVPTDANGVQRVGEEVTRWPLPDGTKPGDPVEPAMGAPLVLRDLDGLLDDLGERIFIAEVLEGSGPGRARLLVETAWNLHEAARFALDCAEHAIAEPDSLVLPSGTTAAEIVSAARQHLDADEDQESGLMQRMSRLASARRLRKLGTEVADAAFAVALADEADDLDALDDPAWTAVAAVRDALLAAVEAIRHDSLGTLLEGENRRYQSDAGMSEPEPIATPWGVVSAGGRSGTVPAWVAARDAAERARQAVSDARGPDNGDEERAWQLGRLLQALGPNVPGF